MQKRIRCIGESLPLAGWIANKATVLKFRQRWQSIYSRPERNQNCGCKQLLPSGTPQGFPRICGCAPRAPR